MASGLRDAYYRTRTSLPAYDAARWLAPPPELALVRTFASGLKCVVQIGASADTDSVQEAIVSDRIDDSLLIFPDGTRSFDLYLGAKPTQPRAPVGFAAMGASVQARWVSRPTRARMVQFHVPKALQGICRGLDFDGRYGPLDSHLSHLVGAFAADLDAAASDDLLLESWMHLLLCKIRGDAGDRSQGGLAPWQVRRVTELIESRLVEKLSLADLAGAVGLSTFHFARQFKRSVGEPPHAYALRLRLEAAKRALACGDAPLSEIAKAAGFADYRSFARRFKRHFHAAPSEIRRWGRGA